MSRLFGPLFSLSKAFFGPPLKEIHLNFVTTTFKKTRFQNFPCLFHFWTFLRPQKCPNSDFFHQTLLEIILWVCRGDPCLFPKFLKISQAKISYGGQCGPTRPKSAFVTEMENPKFSVRSTPCGLQSGDDQVMSKGGHDVYEGIAVRGRF